MRNMASLLQTIFPASPALKWEKLIMKKHNRNASIAVFLRHFAGTQAQ